VAWARRAAAHGREVLRRLRAGEEESPDRAGDDALDRLRREAWPEGLLATLERLGTSASPAYLVGGSVRDVVLGRPPGARWDVATALVPEEVARRFGRVVPIGIAHGTTLVLEGGLEIECTTFRREGGYSDARRPDRVEFTDDPVADLARRDLTVNAMAYDPLAGRLLDPHGGARDLERRVLRAVGDPVARFREDALRPLRVARLAAVLEMDPDDATRAAMGQVRDRAGRIAMERVRDEWNRMLAARRPSRGLELLRGSGLLALWAPEIERCVGVTQNRWHAYDVYGHLLETCDAAPADKPRVRWAALLHDVGKPDTRGEKRGEGTFYRHEAFGAEIADRMLERFRFPLEERRAIVHLVREHMFDYRREWSDAALRRFLRRVGESAVADLFDLRIADTLGNGRKTGFPTYLELMRRRIEGLLAADHALSVRDLAVDGTDVMRELGIGPGPRVGRELEELLERVMDEPASNRRDLLIDALRRRRDEAAVRRPEA
jgi:tRNA nucleotidyltransferase (CCA-adding enzyme)